MKILPFVILILLLTNCAQNGPQDNELKGNWINESITLKTELSFLNNSRCEFFSSSKLQNSDMRIPCKYIINEDNIEIYQTDQNYNIVNRVFNLEYDSFSNVLLLRRSVNDTKPIIFEKK